MTPTQEETFVDEGLSTLLHRQRTITRQQDPFSNKS